MSDAVITALITSGFAFLGIVAGLLKRQDKKLSEVKEHTAEARKQVQNSHSTNLRDDLDKVISGLGQVLAGQARHDEALRQHGQEIGGLRRDLTHERAERLAVSERLDRHIDSVER
ncbi:hypothetical protein ALI22I_34000 [Saccharothrix sp. ALI-22-I]|uniref:DUF2746 domain-containing protein n=1 Tax=Saccharothrix sp. ALI-22-I TaxID=1933778 RepID=UPI00097BBD38|nr:DUF2746 domain-containing protein [Saccharothrix sp. ALI-22-I]ONI83509.1 hypothetical protein ALI22I_34000 [Saccharothrix sp. ALI-22-I]